MFADEVVHWGCTSASVASWAGIGCGGVTAKVGRDNGYGGRDERFFGLAGE